MKHIAPWILLVVFGIALYVLGSRNTDLHVDNLTPEVHVAAPQVSVASPVCMVTNQVNVSMPQMNLDGMAASLLSIGAKVVDAEKMREDFERQRIADDEKRREASRDMELQRVKSEESRYARNAMYYINYINMVVTKIVAYNNPAVLEEEYNAISLNSIRLDTIKDAEVIDIIQDIMDYITEMRLQERQRAMLKYELDQGMSDALVDSFSAIGTGGGLTPLGMAVNLVSSAASAGMNYRRAINNLKAKHAKEEWKLDNEKIKELNELNKCLLRNYWQIMRRYGLDDNYRVTEDQISRFYARLKDDDEKRRNRFLKVHENEYMALPVYWFYRGESSYRLADYFDAEDAFAYYQNTQDEFDKKWFAENHENAQDMCGCGRILRRDPVSAKVAMLRAETRLQLRKAGKKFNNDKAFFEEQIRIIKENTLDDEWSMRYYATILCGSELNDIKKAKKLLEPTIDELEARRDLNLITWQESRNDGSAKKKGVDSLVASGDALMRCKQLLIELEANTNGSTENRRENSMREICERESTSAREKIFMYGAMRYQDALKYMADDIKKIDATLLADDKVAVDLPLSWICSKEGEMGVCVLSRKQNSDIFEKDKPYYGNCKRAIFNEDNEDDDDRSLIETNTVAKCRIVFTPEKERVKPQTVLFVNDYDIRNGNEEVAKAKTRLVIEYEVPSDGDRKLKLMRAGMGKYDGASEDGKWISCNKIEF